MHKDNDDQMSENPKPKGKKAPSKEKDKKTIFSASFPGLVDLVTKNNEIYYFYKDADRLQVDNKFINKTGQILIPPDQNAIPFKILTAVEIWKNRSGDDQSLYWEIFKTLRKISVLPSEKYYHLLTVYIFFTYLPEGVSYYPYLWFFGVPERGKSRITKAIINLSYRGLYTETLNQAYIFRYAELFRGTIGIDVYGTC